ncbi:MAG: hypothetical protein HGA72_02540, partial [Chlorobiaceae bacterium]|nr:hypothetical protein [Chlorobiaceae bacterium]
DGLEVFHVGSFDIDHFGQAGDGAVGVAGANLLLDTGLAGHVGGLNHQGSHGAVGFHHDLFSAHPRVTEHVVAVIGLGQVPRMSGLLLQVRWWACRFKQLVP